MTSLRGRSAAIASPKAGWFGKARLLIVLPFALTALALGGLQEDEFECEQAVSAMEECCPELNAHAITCTNSSGCGTSVDPAFTLQESHCIEQTSCATMKETRMCERAARRKAQVLVFDGGVGVPTVQQETVCP
jgi:hypothetical protein